MSCLRLRAMLSRPISLAIANSSAIDFFFNSVKFIDKSLAVDQVRTAVSSTTYAMDKCSDAIAIGVCTELIAM
ncbi:hypothetical protein GCM10009129_20440 [Psychrobacter aestuarii]|uniref:Uncharacterized protein n=1 Tax=Psychrobacter aestuarii TaxID=556327 RepID=A0ABP3FS51_9GAMM